MTLSIVIVNWNAGDQLRACTKSIALACAGMSRPCEVFVVDNASTDDSALGVEQCGLSVRLFANTANRGFAAACNQGAREAQGEYLLFLNPDTRLFADSLSAPIEFMDRPENAAIGICGIRLVDDSGNTSTCAARFPSLGVLTGATLGLAKFFPKIFPPHLMTPQELSQSQVVDQVIGAFFLIRRDVFDRCGGFDERFFVYFEEVDLSLRAKHLGYASYFLSDVAAFHKGGGCSEQVKAARLFYSLRSRVLYAKKHYSAAEFVGLVLLMAVELPLRLGRSVVRMSRADLLNTLMAYRQLAGYFLRSA
ncbi:MAG: glycosyltransferase family 2 protein [Sulfuritalea sp.]|nr:glycosyltransferase family 2 protein [Sulfuritalea sp.]